jgi:hypothetical protein
MTCLQCGAEMRMKRENCKYDASSLPGITLLGVEVSRCPKCGEHEVAIPLSRACTAPLPTLSPARNLV